MQESSNYLIHFGNKNSGRYRRGSGENPHQHDGLNGFKSGHARRVAEARERRSLRKGDNMLSRIALHHPFTGTYRNAARMEMYNKNITKNQALREAKSARWHRYGKAFVGGIISGVGSTVAANVAKASPKVGLGISAVSKGVGLGLSVSAIKDYFDEKKEARSGHYKLKYQKGM